MQETQTKIKSNCHICFSFLFSQVKSFCDFDANILIIFTGSGSWGLSSVSDEQHSQASLTSKNLFRALALVQCTGRHVSLLLLSPGPAGPPKQEPDYAVRGEVRWSFLSPWVFCSWRKSLHDGAFLDSEVILNFSWDFSEWMSLL